MFDTYFRNVGDHCLGKRVPLVVHVAPYESVATVIQRHPSVSNSAFNTTPVSHTNPVFHRRPCPSAAVPSPPVAPPSALR